jgi:hypothetical protein
MRAQADRRAASGGVPVSVRSDTPRRVPGTRRWLIACAAAVVIMLCAGCGLKDPSVRASASGTASSTETATATTHTVTTVTTTVSNPAAVTAVRSSPDPAPGDDDDDDDADEAPHAAPAGLTGTAYNVAYRFASAYANVSLRTIASHLQTMISLATPAYARALRGGAGKAQLEAARGLPPGERMVARVLSVQLSDAQGSFEPGVVTLQLAMTSKSGGSETPFTSTDNVELLRRHGAWSVASFGEQS